MKTSDLYKEYFDALQKRWEPVIREYFKNKLSYQLKRNKKNHSISVTHVPRNEDLIMLLQLKNLIKEFKDSKFDPLNCQDVDFDPQKIADCIENRIKKEVPKVKWDSIYKERTELEYYDKYSEEGKPFTIMDVYGIYISKAPRSFRSEIEIYISRIYYDCLDFGWDIEALYVIVLCHELAHGYHHLGIDSDDNYWRAYGDLEIEIKEGLAQYYTEKFIKSNPECKNKNFISVFNNLCSKQGPQYSVHNTWPKMTYEATRIVMVESRKTYLTKYKDFHKKILNYSHRV